MSLSGTASTHPAVAKFGAALRAALKDPAVALPIPFGLRYRSPLPRALRYLRANGARGWAALPIPFGLRYRSPLTQALRYLRANGARGWAAPRLAELGAIVPADDKLTPAGLQTWLQQETLRYAPVIKAAGQFAD